MKPALQLDQLPWTAAPDHAALLPQDVHVWRTWLDHEPGCIERLGATLSHDERARANRFHFDRDRSRFVAARATLRAILGRYLQCDPAALAFGYGAKGKPFLAAPRAIDMRFNVSHADALAVYAVSNGRDIGVDVERIDRRVDVRIADRFFSQHERAALRSTTAARVTEAFFAIWTRKEAYIKGKGEGLSLRLDAFDVSIGEPAALLRSDDHPDDAQRWQLVNLSPAPDYTGALAVEGGDCTVARWAWSAPCGCTTVREARTR
jgi:4'-phosphopantetheinyl transferase